MHLLANIGGHANVLDRCWHAKDFCPKSQQSITKPHEFCPEIESTPGFFKDFR